MAKSIAVFAIAAFTATSAAAEPGGYIHENGIGPDPDHDTNPATITGVIKRVGDAAQTPDDAPYRVIDFEAPPGGHGDVILNAYEKTFGVKFGRGLTRQICDGQRRFTYDSICTYMAAPSGDFAAGYVNYLNAPLLIEFKKPVCVVTMAIYPTGGAQDEPFTVTISGWDRNGAPLPDASAEFEWTKNTVRWRHMAGAYYPDARAQKVTVSMKSGKASEAGDVLRYLIDDLAFVQDGCDDVLAELSDDDDANAAEPLPPSADAAQEDEEIIEGS